MVVKSLMEEKQEGPEGKQTPGVAGTTNHSLLLRPALIPLLEGGDSRAASSTRVVTLEATRINAYDTVLPAAMTYQPSR